MYTPRMRGGTPLTAALIALIAALLLTPTTANAAPNKALSSFSYQNSFETFSERDPWTKHQGDSYGYIGADYTRPHSGTMHMHMSAYTGIQRLTLRFLNGVPEQADCTARIWATFTGNGNARFIVRDSSGRELAGLNFQLTVDKIYREYILPGFFPTGDNTFDFSIILQGPGQGSGEVNLDDFSLRCAW